MWDFQAFTAPDTLDPLVVHTPAIVTQQCRDPAITVASVFGGQIDYGPRERRFVIAPNQPATLSRSRLPQGTTALALRHAQLMLNVPNRSSSSLGA